MSLATFKRKSIHTASRGTNISGRKPGGIWRNNVYGPEGFSLNGGHRNVGYVGQSMAMSRNGTPYYGKFPQNARHGQIGVDPVFNVNRNSILGTQAEYIKPSVLSTRGMLRLKYRWAYNGQYPNFWVQPNYTGNLTDSASQAVYIQSLAAKNSGIIDINNPEKYVAHLNAGCGDCEKRRNFTDINSYAPYSKTLYQPLSGDQYVNYIQRKCMNPVGAQKPYPYAVSGLPTTVSQSTVISSGNGCATTAEYPTVAPPEWYTSTSCKFESEVETRE